MIGRIVRGLWRFITAAKNATGNLIFLAILALVVISAFTPDSITIPNSAALIINPTGNIVEQKKVIDPVAEFLSGYDNEATETLLKDILDAIDAAGGDGRIKVLILDLDKLQGAAFSKLEEIGDALDTFKQSGKPVYAFARSYSQSQYYLATHADKVYIEENSGHFLGGVFLTGLGVYPIYFKSALEKYSIDYHVYKAGLYKSAVEPYERDNMSAEAKLANMRWLNHLWDEYRQTVTSEREISPADFDQYANHYDELLDKANNNPDILAVQHNLVDDLITREEWIGMLSDIVGSHAGTYSKVGLGDYLATVRPAVSGFNPGSSKIAVITASGVIYDGEQPAGNIGSDSITKLIRQAREDNSVKALVVRLDSPGGSPSASEQIRNELDLTQKAGKPVVISMGSYAASGGYWIAATANKIFAASTTITGSIGAFATLPTFQKTAAEFGITSDGVGTTNLSGSLNLLTEMNPRIDRTIRKSVEYTYSRFINLVARGRNMTPEQVETLAEGRVWAATDALKHGLIDAIGNLDEAIDSAALLADIGSYEVIYLEKTLSAKEKLLNELLNTSLGTFHQTTSTRLIPGLNSIYAVSREMQTIIELGQKPGIYLRCLECRLSQ